LLGLCLITGYAAAQHRVATAAVGIVAGGLIYLTVLRTGVWRNTATLFTSVLEQNPRSLPALINLTKWYTDLGEYDRAIEYGRRAVEVAPEGTPGRRNLAAALKRAGRLDEAVKVWPEIVDRP
jgi:tetratricopeptide (TPR) repeat protein